MYFYFLNKIQVFNVIPMYHFSNFNIYILQLVFI